MNIESVGELGGQSYSPYVVVKHRGREKWVIFNSKNYLENPKQIELTIASGYFNFEIIKDKKLFG